MTYEADYGSHFYSPKHSSDVRGKRHHTYAMPLKSGKGAHKSRNPNNAGRGLARKPGAVTDTSSAADANSTPDTNSATSSDVRKKRHHTYAMPLKSRKGAHKSRHSNSAGRGLAHKGVDKRNVTTTNTPIVTINPV